jgi:hypothetical protein
MTMITAIYDLREYGFIHTDTTSISVTWSKYFNGANWQVMEFNEGDYKVMKNNSVKLHCAYLEQVEDFLTEHKLLDINEV